MMEGRESQQLEEMDKHIFEAIDRKLLEHDVGGVVGEGDVHIIANMPSKNMSCAHSKKNKTEVMNHLSKALASEHNDSEAKTRILSALVGFDMYKLSKEIIESECPSIYYGITSWHYV